MKLSRSSPADLDRQLLVVHRLASCAGADLRTLEAARDRLIADVRAAVDLRALEAVRDRLVADVRSRWLARAPRRSTLARCVRQRTVPSSGRW
jgi:ribosomal 50S subunit-associated protein YjgA (DUF615 family)